MANLASKPDLVARLGRDFSSDESARVDALLADSSAMVRSYTRQHFTPQTETVILRAQGGLIRLPQRPVTAVSQVKAIGINGAPDVTLVDWWWDGLDVIRLASNTIVINMPEVWYDDLDGYPGTYSTSYTHGGLDVPGDVVRVVCGMVLRTLTAPTSVGGVTSETIGPYSYRLESAGVGTSVSMSDQDRRDLARYRQTAGTISTRPH